MVELNTEIHNLRIELLSASGLSAVERQIAELELDEKLAHRIWMVLGEGSVFTIILLLGFRAVARSIAKELTLAEQQKNFLLSITHELKSPLSAIKLQLQTLRSRNLPEQKRNMLYDRALKDTGRLQKLVENLLIVNKVEAGRLPLIMEKTNLTQLITELVQNSYSENLDNGVLILKLEEDVAVKADVLALQSVVSNLIDNALKYASDSKIEISLQVDQGVVLKVSDQGPGIPDEDKKKVFDRFFRLGSEETRNTKGTGIGLYLVRLFVELHYGNVNVEDNQPSGAIFKISLPEIVS